MRMVTRVAAVHLHALPVECVFDEEGIPDTPCAVRDEVKGRQILVGLSDSARQAGLWPNMTQSEGKARLARLQVRARNRAREVEHLHAAAEMLMAFGPYVEVGAPNMLWVEIGRGQRELSHRLGGASEEAVARAIIEVFKEAGHRVTVAIASDPSTARTLAQHLAQSRWAPAESKKTRPLRRRQRVRGSAQKRRPSAASKQPDYVVVPEHQTEGQLGRLPLEAILWTDPNEDPDGILRGRLQEVAGSLKLLGVHDVARLATLPAAQISSRFGDAGALLARRAIGADDRPLRPFVPTDRLTESFELDSVIEDLEPALFILRRLFSRLEARLEARRLATTEVQMHFVIEPGLTDAIDPQAPKARSSRRQISVPLRLARPTRKAKTLLAVAREKLDGQLPGAVWSVEIEAHAPSRDQGAQLDLFSSFARKVEDVSELISRLQAALGPQAVFSPQLEDTHRPEAAWSLSTFDIEQALAEPTTVKPKPVEHRELSAPALESTDRILYALPTVDESLSVTGAHHEVPSEMNDVPANDAVSSVITELAERPWPKPVPRKQEDEPMPPLPPRPMALFAHPERASILKSTGLDEGVLVWRGHRHHLVAMTGSEQLETEWWTSRPVDRDYVVAEVEDGRRFWMFFDPQGEAFVHGLFD